MSQRIHNGYTGILIPASFSGFAMYVVGYNKEDEQWRQ